MATFLGGGQLIFEVRSSRSRFDYRLHQFKSIQGAAESSFCVGDDGRHPVHAVLAVHVMDLVSADKGIIDAANNIGNTINWVQALIRIHMSSIVGVCRDLPAAKIDGLQSGLDLLHCLVACKSAEGSHIIFVAQQVPKALGTQARESVFNLD